MGSLVSAEPSSRGCGVCARAPSAVTRRDSFSTPLRPPCSHSGWPLPTRAERRFSKERSIAGFIVSQCHCYHAWTASADFREAPMLVGSTVRRVAVLGGLRIPFARAHGAYASVGNQEMLTAT